jgi:hypothetical protein
MVFLPLGHATTIRDQAARVQARKSMHIGAAITPGGGKTFIVGRHAMIGWHRMMATIALQVGHL